MRLSNSNKASIYNSVSILLLMITTLSVILFFVNEYRCHIIGKASYLLIIIPFLLLMIYYIKGRQIFEYDSDGEVLNFKNRNIFPFLDKSIYDEVPKYKLIKYEIVSCLFFRILYITLSSKNNRSTILKYYISYLNKKQINNLKISLNKIVRANKREKDKETNDDRRILA